MEMETVADDSLHGPAGVMGWGGIQSAPESCLGYLILYMVMSNFWTES